MRTEPIIKHVTDDLGNDVLTPFQVDQEFAALSAVADAAELEHRVHCRLLTSNCALCKALAELDEVRQRQWQHTRN